jgi:predicted GNAT family N-acyltransferase
LRKNIPLPYEFQGDFNEDTFHLGAFKDNNLIAVSTFMKSKNELFKGEQYQLRGMATLIQYQGYGAGRKMMETAFQMLQEKNIAILWCNARVAALNFYRKVGMEAVGKPFDVKYIGDHYVMYKNLN